MIKHSSLNNGIPISTELGQLKDSKYAVKQPGKRRLIFICIAAISIAMATSVIARALIMLINLFTNISFYGRISISNVSPADNNLGWWVLLVPVAGGVVIGLMALYGSKAIRGHGIPEAMEQILTNKSKIAPIVTWLKPLSSAISIGTGGPFGAEGPIIATGGALGSTIGQLLKISDHERKILLAAGAAAGMAAIFDTPIAAIFLSVELLLFEFSPKSMLPVALACITGAAGHHLLFGTGYVFAAPNIEMPQSLALAVYSAMGLLIGLIAALVTKSVYWIEDAFEKLPVHWMWWPAIGGLAVGLVGKFAPRTMGVGYENITDIISGTLSFKIILFLCFMKFISWAIALGSGTSGGTLAPLLTIGGATGVLIAMFVDHVLPGTGITFTLAAIVGMSAMFAGASRALLTSIVFALESTGQLHALLPLLGACTASYLVSYFLMENTIMTEKIVRRGVKTPDIYEPDILEQTSIGQVIIDGGFTINGENTLQEVRNWLNDHKNNLHNNFIVVGQDGEYLGIAGLNDFYKGGQDEKITVKSIMQKNLIALSADNSLRIAVEMMAHENLEVLPVISHSGSNKVIGVLSYKDILSAYRHGMNEHTEVAQHISLKRRGIKILVNGQRLISKFGI